MKRRAPYLQPHWHLPHSRKPMAFLLMELTNLARTAAPKWRVHLQRDRSPLRRLGQAQTPRLHRATAPGKRHHHD